MAKRKDLNKGMKVLLDPRKCTQEDLDKKSSCGVIGKEYVIDTVGGRSCLLEGVNWHMHEWLTIVGLKNKIGGKLNGKV